MSSIKKLLFKNLCDHLQEQLQFNDDIPSVRWVDKDLGQAELIQSGDISLPLPAVLVSFPTTGYEGELSNDQTGTTAIQIRVLFENYFDAGAGSPNRDLALQFFEFNERVHNAVLAFAMEKVSGLTRIGEDEDSNHKNVIVTDIIYQAVISDVADNSNTYTSASPTPRPAIPTPPNIEIVKNFIIPDA